ncbi:MAG: glycoside hydrolase family 28 protein [Alphaproteobacteria bacterium]|nr:glycoside hydrolase family 28 protein [Alphaproteobacteria bacterium]MDE2111316.1 glycoside hydrolase family 28 protein [Alphaproteobacteria bacterium]MDE2495631.1 glycoside hydrolase family 28 protein [Alphaproteobacteria bacterium]
MTNRRQLLQASIATGVTTLVPQESLAAAKAIAGTSPWDLAAEIVARIKPPVFPKRDFPITAFGAVGGGAADCTKSIAAAVEACNKAGGGRVVVPQGVWLTGAIRLKSDVDFHLAKGAVVRFNTDPKAYLPLVLTRWEGIELMNYSPLIYAFEQENIAVTGEGMFDGQADNVHWWPWKGLKQWGWREGRPNQLAARNKLSVMGEADTPVSQRIFGEGSYLRPTFFEPYRCRNVMIDGVTIRNTPFWEVHPVLCTNVTVSNLTVDSAGPNTDGCDPECCKDVLIENCSFNTGDDCIAIKSGRNNDGRRVNVPSENIVIRNCRMKNGHGGVAIGSEISGDVRHVFAENCHMDGPALGSALRLKNNAMRGGLLEHFYFRRIVVGEVAHAVLTIDFNYEEGPNGPYTPVVRDVRVETVVSGKSRYGIDVQGLAAAPIYGVALRDCDFEHVADGNIIKNVRGLSLRNVKLNGEIVRA